MEETFIGGQRRDFPPTRWSSLLELRDPSRPDYQEHLTRLIERYWKPVYHYARALRPLSVEDAKDLTQEFFAMLLRRRDMEKISPERGSFRGFLKRALRNFLLSADRAAFSRRPQDSARLLRFEEADADWMEAVRKSPATSPEEAFDREWSREVLMEAVGTLERSLASEGKETYFRVFQAYCLDPAGRLEAAPQESYTDLAGRLQVSEDDVRNYLRYARRRIREILQELVRDYLDGDQGSDEEVRFLLSS